MRGKRTLRLVPAAGRLLEILEGVPWFNRKIRKKGKWKKTKNTRHQKWRRKKFTRWGHRRSKKKSNKYYGLLKPSLKSWNSYYQSSEFHINELRWPQILAKTTQQLIRLSDIIKKVQNRLRLPCRSHFRKNVPKSQRFISRSGNNTFTVRAGS